MLFTITTTHRPATDLGHLLHKHPQRVQSFDLKFGQVHVFYPEADPERCTAALLLDIDSIKLKRRQSGDFTLSQYVNDRPYVASSLLSVAIARVYSSAMKGRSDELPELAASPIPLQAHISALPCRGGAQLLRDLFTPLGYELTIEGHPLDATFPDWGQSPYYTVTLDATARLCDLLTHLYVLIPVLDDEKHYYVDDEEVDKLLRHGQGWLAAHPERELITARYLKHQRGLQRDALSRLLDEEPADQTAQHDVPEAAIERALSLQQHRLQTVLALLAEIAATRVLDLGCGDGQLLELLLRDSRFSAIAGLDVSHRALERASARLHLDRLPPIQRQRLELLHGSLLYRDARLEGYDAAVLMEVIEHLDPPRLAACERVVFACAHPATVLVTTPNAEYNAHWESLPAGHFRHPDHRFEWTRDQFHEWSNSITERFHYHVRFHSIGPEDSQLGPPSQMAIFTRP